MQSAQTASEPTFDHEAGGGWRLHRRWTVVAAATLGTAGGYGGISTIAVLIEPFRAEFGWAKADISSANLLLTIGVAFGGLLAGRLVDRFPTGPIAAAGILFIGLALVALSMQTSVLGMRIVYLTMGFLGFSCLYAPLLTTVSLWFRDGPGLALGIVTAGGALGQALVAPLFQMLVIGFGWRDASFLLGTAYIVILLPAMLPVRKPQTSEVLAAAGGGAQPAWPLPPILSVSLLGLAGLFCCALMGVPSVHLVSLAISAGLEAPVAAGVVTVTMVAGCIGRLATGLVIDRIGALAAYALVGAVQTFAVYGFAHAGAGWALYAVGAAYGIGFGGAMTALVCAVREAVPEHRLGTAMSVVGMLAWLGMGAGAWQGGLCFDLTGDYTLSFTLAGVLGAGSLAMLAVLRFLVKARRAGRRASHAVD